MPSDLKSTDRPSDKLIISALTLKGIKKKIVIDSILNVILSLFSVCYNTNIGTINVEYNIFLKSIYYENVTCREKDVTAQDNTPFT